MEEANPNRVLLVVSLATGLSLSGDSALYAILPIRAAEFGLALGMVGILLSANRFIRIVLNGPMGVLTDKWPRRHIFVPSVFLGALSTLLVAISPGFWLILVARLLWGVSWAGLWVSGNAIVMDAAPMNKRGRWIGYYHLAFFLGAALGSILAGILTDQIGFRQALLVAAGLTLLGAVAATLFLPLMKPKRSEKSAPAKDEQFEQGPSERGQLATAAALLGINRVVMAGVLAATLGIWLTLQFGDKVDIGGRIVGVATLTGVGNGLGLLIAMIVSPASGALSDRFSNRWGVASSGLFLGVAGFSLLATGTAVGLLFGVPLTYTSSGSNQGLSTSITGDLSTQDHYGRRLGVLFTVGDIGSAIGPLLAFALLPLTGLSWIYLGSAGLLAVILLISLSWAIRRPQKRTAAI